MKQIEFTLEAFGPDGMLKEGYKTSKDIVYIRYFEDYERFAIVYADGSADDYAYDDLKENKLYRRTRTAEEVARELDGWRNYHPSSQQDIIKAVQAGMDEMKND